MKTKILIVEDNLDILELYKIYFTKAGFEVHTSENGLMGVVDIVNLDPDIILLDIMMPQMNWFEVLEAIKNQSSITAPIIVCSNLSQQSDADKALKLWADMYITKSDYEVSEIIEKTNSLLHSQAK